MEQWNNGRIKPAGKIEALGEQLAPVLYSHMNSAGVQPNRIRQEGGTSRYAVTTYSVGGTITA